MSFYEIVRHLCYERGISLYTMSKDIHISNGTVSAWKQGSFPQGETLKKIADYFGVSTDYLMTGKQPEAIATYDADLEIFTSIDALKNRDIRRIVLRLSTATKEDIGKVSEMLDILSIGGSVDV